MTGSPIVHVARAVPAWILSVGGTWLLSTLLLAEMARHDLGGSLIPSLVRSAAVCSVACLAIGGPATAVALVLRQRHRLGIAVAGGLAVGCLAFVIVFVAANAGVAAISGLAPVALILAVEFSAAFVLLRRTRRVCL